jgi:phage-related protein
VARKLAVGEKPLLWVGSSREDLLLFPDEVKDGLGAALSVAQFGGKHPSAKVWKGEGPGVLEVVDNFMGDTYCAVYTVRFARASVRSACVSEEIAARPQNVTAG